MTTKIENQADKELQRGREIMRLAKLARENPEDLLEQALSGRPKEVDTLCSLYKFVFDFSSSPDPLYEARPTFFSDTTRRYWRAIEPHLIGSGVTKQDLERIRQPYPRPGEPGFKSVLEELNHESRNRTSSR